MHFWPDFTRLRSEMENLVERDRHHLGNDAKFAKVKREIEDSLNRLFGENSREYRVVKLTASPATVVKVLNHIAGRKYGVAPNSTAANM